jgi:hypothetical protein
VITLNTDKGLIRVESWEDIEARPGFVSDLNPAEHNLETIIGRYVFREKIRCGLSNCHTPHAKGYIVVTKDGQETNIGKDCGRTYFGVDFETLSRRFDRDITEKENREKLWSFTFQLDELKSKIAELRGGQRGADWVYKNSRPLVSPNKGCPDAIVRRVTEMVKMRTNILTAQRQASAQEVDDLEAIRGQRVPRPHYIDEPIANIAGLEALYPENDLRSIVILNLDEKLREFEGLNIDTMSYETLRSWVQWVSTIERTIDHGNEVVAHGLKLLQPQNVQPLFQVLASQEDKNIFRAFIKNLSV